MTVGDFGLLTSQHGPQFYSRIGLVIGSDPAINRATILVCSGSVKCTFRGTEHRWIPLDGSTRLLKQPPETALTNPQAALSSLSNPAYTCFTHALRVEPVLQGSPIPVVGHGNAQFKHTTSVTESMSAYSISCANLGDIRKIHKDYWTGVRNNVSGEMDVSREDKGCAGAGGDGGGGAGAGGGGDGGGGGRRGGGGPGSSEASGEASGVASGKRKRTHSGWYALCLLCACQNDCC